MRGNQKSKALLFLVLRLGRCIDTLYSVLPLFHYPDTTVRITVILSKISNALFLLTDHILWLGRADLCNVNTEKWSRISNKYWLYSITLNLVRDFYEVMNILKSQKCRILPSDGFRSFNDVITTGLRTASILQRHRSIMIDTIKNSCDFFIPLTALGHVNLSPSSVGLLGVISSLAGLMVLIEPLAKLTPA